MENGRTRIVCLVNDEGAGGLRAEHGLAFWIERGPRRVLFDAGQGEALAANAAALGVELGTVDAVALSHGHYDHSGGLTQVLGRVPRAPVYTHPEALAPKYSGQGGEARFIGMPEASRQAAERAGGQWVWTVEPAEIIPGLWLTGPIPRDTSYEDTGGPFYRDEALEAADPLTDDQAAYFMTEHGAVVVLGCAHAGVVNTLDYVAALTGGAPLHAVLGGMHLLSADDNRIEATVERLGNADLLAPSHCTGGKANDAIRRAYGERVSPCPAGAVFEF